MQTGIEAVSVRVPRVRDRGVADDGAPSYFTFSVLPSYLRRIKRLEKLLDSLKLKGISTKSFRLDASGAAWSLRGLVCRYPPPRV